MVIIVILIAITIIMFQYQGCHGQEKTNILQGQEKVKGNLWYFQSQWILFSSL